MFEAPTSDDFVAQLRMQKGRGISALASEIMRIKSDMSRRGALRSSMTIRQMLDALDKAVEDGTAAILGELRRAATATNLDKGELRELTHRALDEFLADAVAAASWKSVTDWLKNKSVDDLIESRVSKLRENQQFWIRQSDVGFHVKAEPKTLSTTTNVLHASTIIGGVQQGTTSSQQAVNVTLDFAKVASAVADAERELASADFKHAALDEIHSDLSTIKAQLTKPEPNTTILREAGKSIRNVAEGVLGGLLTTPALLAISNLSIALGL